MSSREFHVVHGTNGYTVCMALRETYGKLLPPRMLVRDHKIPLCSGERIGGSNLDWLSAFELGSHSGRHNHECLVEATRYAMSAVSSRTKPIDFNKEELALRIELDFHTTNCHKREQIRAMRLANLNQLTEILNDSSNDSHQALMQYGAIPAICLGTTSTDTETLKSNPGSSITGEVLIKELLIRHIITTTHQDKLLLDELIKASQASITTSLIDCELTRHKHGFGDKLTVRYGSPMQVALDEALVPFDMTNNKIVMLPMSEIRKTFAKSRRSTNQKNS